MPTFESVPSNRRLAAVMFLDMVRYSALMAKDEARALANLKDLKRILQGSVTSFGGRIVKALGDGFLMEFPTAISAVTCGKQVLAALNTRNHVRPSDEHVDVRIALQIGDVVEDKGDLFGDAVNIAARLQPLCDPNGIIMTEMVYVQVCNQVALKGTFTPPRKLKNIPTRLRVFQTAPEGVDLTFWSLRKQGWVAAAVIFLVTVAVLSTGAVLLERRWSQAHPRTGLLYVLPQNDRGTVIARNMEEEINIKFSTLKKLRWVERAALLGLFQEAGVEDLEKPRDLEAKAHGVARKGGLQYALYGGVEKLNKNRWRLTLKVVDTRNLDSVKVFTVSGEDSASIVTLMRWKFEQWLKESD